MLHIFIPPLPLHRDADEASPYWSLLPYQSSDINSVARCKFYNHSCLTWKNRTVLIAVLYLVHQVFRFSFLWVGRTLQPMTLWTQRQRTP